MGSDPARSINVRDFTRVYVSAMKMVRTLPALRSTATAALVTVLRCRTGAAACMAD
jgi:hypothetical protein